MNKTVLVVSAVMTAFVLVMLGGVVYAYQSAHQVSAAPVVDNQALEVIQQREAAYQGLIEEANRQLTQQPSSPAQAGSTTTPDPAQSVTAEQAATIAAQELGQTDIYSVKVIPFQKATFYQVTFSSGDMAIVGQDGKVLLIQRAPLQSAQTTRGVQPNRQWNYEQSEHEFGGDDD